MIDDLRSCKRPLLVSLLILIGIYLFHFQLYSHYLVFGDDPAVFAGSAGSPWQWITVGFSRYFIVYPEWTVPFTDFLRPASNLILRCEQIAFHQHYALYFAAFYFAQFLVCASVVVISYRFGVQGLWLILIGALSAISPAFLGLDLISVVFQFDVWCGLFALLALYLILDRRYYWSIFFLLLAVFTKEPTLYAPMAACFTTYSQTRRKLISAAMLLPLVAWIAVRKFIFVGSARNVYALQSGTSQFLLSLVKGITQWPSGILENLALKNILTERSISHQLPDVFILFANFVLWVLLLAGGSYFLRRRITPDGSRASDTPSVLALFVWLSGALSFGVLVGLDPRFGGSIYPLELIVCAVVAHQTSSTYLRRGATLAVSLLLVAFVFYSVRTEPAMRRVQAQYAATFQQLIIALNKYRSVDGVVYILNGPPSFSSPESIAKQANTSSKIVILSSFDGCAQGSDSATTVAPSIPLHIVTKIPQCASFEFFSVPVPVLLPALGHSLQRGSFATYEFPEIHARGRSLREPHKVDLNFGDVMDIDLLPSNPTHFALLAYDWKTQSYQCLAGRCDVP